MRRLVLGFRRFLRRLAPPWLQELAPGWPPTLQELWRAYDRAWGLDAGTLYPGQRRHRRPIAGLLSDDWRYTWMYPAVALQTDPRTFVSLELLGFG